MAHSQRCTAYLKVVMERTLPGYSLKALRAPVGYSPSFLYAAASNTGQAEHIMARKWTRWMATVIRLDTEVTDSSEEDEILLTSGDWESEDDSDLAVDPEETAKALPPVTGYRRAVNRA